MRLIADHVSLSVPATTANLGAAFDTLGLALDIRDHVTVRAVTGPTRVEVTGEGADTVATGEDHLVVRAIRIGLEYCGAPQAGIDLVCHNAIPHARGLGSSAAAAVVGLVAARQLVSDPQSLDDDAILQLATDLEGHPDNAAPALHGGATLAWMDSGRANALQLEVSKNLAPCVIIPPTTASTRSARAALPRSIPHVDAIFNVQRAALMVEALRRGDAELLFAASDDALHQPYRREVMGASLELVSSLRALGLPAALSGAGPAVFSFTTPDAATAAALRKQGWRVEPVAVARDGVRVEGPRA